MKYIRVPQVFRLSGRIYILIEVFDSCTTKNAVRPGRQLKHKSFNSPFILEFYRGLKGFAIYLIKNSKTNWTWTLFTDGFKKLLMCSIFLEHLETEIILLYKSGSSKFNSISTVSSIEFKKIRIIYMLKGLVEVSPN